jgi:hypothetical protein
LVCYHSINDIPCPYNNKLKGGSAVVNQQQPTTTKQYVFNSEEVGFLGKSLESLRNFVIKNQSQYQNPQYIIKELTTTNNIISARTKQNKQNEQSLKGASSLDNIRKMVGLTSNNESLLNLKGASNICNKKEHLKDLLKQFNLI